MTIQNKVAVVTGASSGLGNATAIHLISKGMRVIALDVKVPENGLLGGGTEGSKNDALQFYPCDVSDADEVRQCVQQGKDFFGSVDVAIACAGIAPAALLHSSKRGSHSSGDFMKTLEINLAGTFHLFNACVPHMKENGAASPDGEKGVLLATSSVAAFEGQMGQSAYAASKGGVVSMILPMARELARHGIRVNAIAPGVFETPMMSGFSAEVRESLEATVPFPRRLGRPSEFAQLVEHILSNSYINGTVIRLDGGVRML